MVKYEFVLSALRGLFSGIFSFSPSRISTLTFLACQTLSVNFYHCQVLNHLMLNQESFYILRRSFQSSQIESDA